MFYRFPDEYFFPVEKIDDLYFEEIGYRHIVVENNEIEGKPIIEENESMVKILGKEKEDIDKWETLSFEEYSIKTSTRTIDLFEEVESNDNDEINEESVEEEANISENIKEYYEGQIIDEFDDNLTREDNDSEIDIEILNEADDEYLDKEIVEDRITETEEVEEVEDKEVEKNKENNIEKIEIEIL